MKKPLFCLLLTFIFFPSFGQLSSLQIDSVVEKTMKVFDVPGIAVAILKDSEVIHSKGYGVASIRTGQKTDEHTRFAIASNSKAFTAASLAMLIDSGKLQWTTRVTDIIPEFKLYAPYVSENFMIADLLCHRSGLGLGAGDLMFWPGNPKFTKSEIIHNLRYLKPVSQFRTKYDYDNLLYLVAGEVVERVSGKSWEEFVEQEIFLPLGMTESAASYSRLKNKANVIDPHVPVEGRLEVVDREANETLNAAGGIYSSVHDMAKWVTMQLNSGRYGTGQQLFSKAVQNNMWTIHTVIPITGSTSYQSQFRGYGLGWHLIDEMGHKVASHTGGLLGMVTQVTLIPDMNLGIIVFTNQQAGAAFTAITNSIKDAYYGMTGIDRIGQLKQSVDAAQKNAMKITGAIKKEIEAAQGKPVAIQKFKGKYRDPWFGVIDITEKNGKLYFEAEKSPKLRGGMTYYKESTFVVTWEDRSLDADAFINFAFDFEGQPVKATMVAISPLTDFSFDFHDLEFTKVK